MKIPTINDYLTVAIGHPFINMDDLSFVPGFIRTDEFQTILTDNIRLKYAGFRLRKMYFGEYKETLIKSNCNAIYRMNAYKYTHLYETTQLDYNPIENYRMVETGTDKNEGETEVITDIGERTITNNNGQQTITYRNGEVNQQLNYGENRQTNQTGVAPNETSVYNNLEQTISTTNARQDTNITNEITNTEQRSDKVDSMIEGGKMDTTNTKNNNTLTHSLERSGNIGVTTSQQMLESERQISDFSIYDIIAKDIIKQLCNLNLNEGWCDYGW